MKNLFNKNYQNFFYKHPELQKENKILLCVSGGIDSICLLHTFVDFYLNKFRFNKIKNLDLQVHVVYVNHGISKHASYWAYKVKESVNLVYEKVQNFDLLSYFSLSFSELNVDLKNYFSETNARNQRYQAILNYCLENNIKTVFTAHHKNDYIENHFISLFRNRIHSFLMKDKTQKKGFENINFYKPLLGLYKSDFEKYLNGENIEHIQDESNFVSNNLRNVIRNDFLPAISLLGKETENVYLQSLENSVQTISYSLSFYQAIIEKQILPNISNVNDKILSLNSHYLERFLFSDDNFNFLRQECLDLFRNYFDLNNSFKDQNIWFIIEMLDKVYFQQYNKKLTSGIKKQLVNNLMVFFNKSLERIKKEVNKNFASSFSQSLEINQDFIITLTYSNQNLNFLFNFK